VSETFPKLDAITTTVLAYRPKDKGLAAEKARKKIAREKAETK